MSRHFLFSALAIMTVVAAGSAGAQDTTTTTTTTTTYDNGSDEGRHAMIFVNGGGWNDLRNLDNSGTADFKTGWNVGGGVGAQITSWMAIRAVYTFSQARGRDVAGFTPVDGVQFDRHYYGGDLQFRAPMAAGFSPYVFVGGGAVTVSPQSNALLFSPATGFQYNNDSFTEGAGRFGIGFEYQIPNTGLGLFAQGDGWVYKWNAFGANRTQVDTNWGVGLSYRFGHGL